MKRIKSTSKLACYFKYRYRYSSACTLWDCYQKPSEAKIKANQQCLDMCTRERGRNYRIISFNIQGFTVAWTVGRHLRVETPKNSYII